CHCEARLALQPPSTHTHQGSSHGNGVTEHGTAEFLASRIIPTGKLEVAMAPVHRLPPLAVGILTLVTIGTYGWVDHAEARAATQVSMPTAHVWVSTPDGAHRMDDSGSVAFHRGGSSKLTITVDPRLRYARMAGC